MSIVQPKRTVRMNAAQYLELLRARIEQRRVDIVMLYTPMNAHVLRVRVH
jgi:hypothetical protein